MLKIKLPDGNFKEVEKGSTIIDVAKAISTSLAKEVIGAFIDEELVDSFYKIENDCSIKLLTKKDKESFEILNHSSAHLLAAAVKELYPNALFAIGPAIEEGFYYDIDFKDEVINDKTLIEIENKMRALIKDKITFTKEVVSKAEALKIFKDDKYKIELIEGLEGEISIYKLGDKFLDLCRGPHLPDTRLIKHFKVQSLAAAYWRGDSSRETLTRIYGTSWFSKEALDEYLELVQQRKERDHRKLGKDLEIYMLDPLAGAGLPIWLPNGMIIKREIERFIIDKEVEYGFQHIETPVMGSVELYKTSGHWAHYQEDMFPPMELENDQLVLRPMSCPHHCLVYGRKQRSYRELPVRLAEQVRQYRFESSGSLTGLERVRGMNLTDSHIYCRPDQIKEEFANAYKLIKECLEKFDVEIDYYSLSLRDKEKKDKYFDDDQMWEKAENMLREALDDLGIEYKEMKGEAAFYGPKLDIQVRTVLGREITMSTIQLDFLLPERFDLNYIDDNGDKVRPVMIHRGLIGTYERFMAILLEQTVGVLPVWLAPKQAVIIPVSLDAHLDYSYELKKKLIRHGVRVDLDETNERLGYKIRKAQTSKIPYQLVVGDNETTNGKVTYRAYGSEEQVTVSVEEFVNLIKN